MLHASLVKGYDDPRYARECSCGAREGEYHVLGCDHELCPNCRVGVSGTCHCMADFLGKYDLATFPETSGYEPHFYHNGPTCEEYHFYWNSQARIPFIDWFPRCGRCGEFDTECRMQPDEEWEKYIIETHPAWFSSRGMFVCDSCFKIVKRFVILAEKYNPIKNSDDSASSN